jgi:hypothetical protein
MWNSNLTKIDFFNNLPQELVELMTSFINEIDIRSCKLVSKLWRYIFAKSKIIAFKDYLEDITIQSYIPLLRLVNRKNMKNLKFITFNAMRFVRIEVLREICMPYILRYPTNSMTLALQSNRIPSIEFMYDILNSPFRKSKIRFVKLYLNPIKKRESNALYYIAAKGALYGLRWLNHHINFTKIKGAVLLILNGAAYGGYEHILREYALLKTFKIHQIISIWEHAIRGKHLKIISWLAMSSLAFKLYNDDDKQIMFQTLMPSIIEAPATVKWELYKWGFQININTIVFDATKEDNIELLQIIHKCSKLPINGNYFPQIASDNGSLRALQYLVSIGCSWKANCIELIAQGRLNILQWAVENNYCDFDLFNINTLIALITTSLHRYRINIAEWLWQCYGFNQHQKLSPCNIQFIRNLIFAFLPKINASNEDNKNNKDNKDKALIWIHNNLLPYQDWKFTNIDTSSCVENWAKLNGLSL